MDNNVAAAVTKASEKTPVKLWLRVSIIALVLLMIIVWGLLTLPIIFYHLPNPAQASSSNRSDIGITKVNVNNTNRTDRGQECLSAAPYGMNGICHSALSNNLLSKKCTPGDVRVLQNAESIASDLLSRLDFLNPSDDCRRAVVPFLCLYLFGLCDKSGVSVQPTSSRCVEIRDRLCPTQWALAVQLGADLPECGSFPMESPSCRVQSGNDSDSSGMGNSSGSGMGSGRENASTEITEDVMTGLPTREPLLQCSEGFFRKGSSGGCMPNCFSFLQYKKGVSIFIDVVVFISAFIGFFTGLSVIVISCLRFKRMFIFPSVFVVYQTIDLIVLAFFVIVTYLDRNSLYCSSMNIIDNFFKVTPFCVIAGMVFTYTLSQLSWWWLFHTTALFWKIRFPFHARSFEMSHKVKYIHATSLILGLLLPLVPIITSIAKYGVDFKSNALARSRNVTFLTGGLGFRAHRSPPILCTGTDKDAVFYSLVLPINIILAIGCTLLIIIFWTVHKQQGLFKAKQSQSPFKFGTAEKKLMIVFFYYVVLAVEALTTFTIATRDSPLFAENLLNFFSCEQRGHNPDRPCTRDFEKYNLPVLTTLAYILLGVFPVVNLIYAVNIQELKALCTKCKAKAKIGLLNNNSLSTGSTGSNKQPISK